MPLTVLTRRSLLLTLFAGAMLPAFGADFTSERISVTTTGAGPDVVLVHGMGSSPRVWKELVAAVPGYKYHMVQVYGFAGHAPGQNKEGVVAAPVAGEIARYISSAALARPTVIGHSMGGTISMMLAARYPGAVSKVMVVDMVPFVGAMFGPPGATADSVRPTADMIATQLRSPDQEARKVRSTATINGMVDTVSMRAGALEDTMKSDQDVVARSFHELVTTDLRPELAKISVPATVLYVVPKGTGMSDEMVDGLYLASYANLKGASLKRIPASAHFIMWDQSAQFQKEVKAFLAP